MKVLLVAHKYPPHSLGGVEVYTQHLARALARDHQVAVFAGHDLPAGPAFQERDDEAGGFLVRRITHRRRGLAASVAGEFVATFLNRSVEASFGRLLDEFRPQVVHFQHVMGLSARLLPLARRSGVPVLLTLHDYWFLCGNSQLVWPDGRLCRGKAWGANCVRCAAAARFPSVWIRYLRPVLAPLFLYRDRLVGRAALQVDALLAPSQFLIDRHVAADFPAGRLLLLENGIPAEEIRRVPRVPPGGRLRLTYLGSIAWQKGLHVLAEAFGGLPTGVATLRIWGDASLFPAYAGQVRSRLTHPDAHWMGRIPNDRVGEVLADSDAVVVPSLWYENSPVVIQEARAAGVPVVASGHGALAEKVRDGVDGLLFGPGDPVALRAALLRLAESPSLLDHLRGNVPPAMDMAEHTTALEEIYRQTRP